MTKTNSGRSRMKTSVSQQSLPHLGQVVRAKLSFSSLSEALTYLSQGNPERFLNLTLRTSSSGTGKILVSFDTTL